MTGKENRIEFFANCSNWVAVKKMKVEDDHDKAEVARFLASVHQSLDRKMWEYLNEEIPLEELDKIAYQLTGAEKKGKKWKVRRKKKEELKQIFADLKSPATTRKIKEHVQGKELVELAKTYLARKVFELLNIQLEPEPKTIEKYIKNKRLKNA